MNFIIISAALKNGLEAFKNNIVAYLVGLLILIIATCLCVLIIPILLIAPLLYGYINMAVKGSRGEKVEIGDMFIGLKSISAFIRSWMYFIVYFVVLIIIAIISALLVKVSPFLSIIGTLLALIWAFIAFFSIYIYVMSSKNSISAYKEGFSVLTGNLLMTIITFIIFFVLCIFLITIPIATVFTATVLKALKPGI